MTIVSRRIVVPFPGKSDLCLERSKRMAEIMAAHGALVRVFRRSEEHTSELQSH